MIFLLVTDMINGHHLPVDGGFLAAPFNNSKLWYIYILDGDLKIKHLNFIFLVIIFSL